MTITELHPPTNGGTLFSGRAQSTRGRHYEFFVTMRGRVLGRAFREEEDGFWLRVVATPAALAAIARRAVRKAVQS